MAFTLKTFNQIVATALNLFLTQSTSPTDINPGAVARTIIEAAAVEEERIYMQMYEGLVSSIDQAAYVSFGFGLLPATAAFGTLTLTRTAAYAPDINILTTHLFTVPNTNKVYAPTAPSTWTGGAGSTTFNITVRCKATGTVGNVPQGMLTSIYTAITGVASCTNAKALFNGTDIETGDQRRQRFGAYVAALPRATKSGIEYGAKTARLLDASGYITEQAVKALASESTGFGTVAIHNGVGTPGGQVTSATLISTCQTIIDGTATVPGYRAAGIPVTVVGAAEQDIQVKTIINTLYPGYSLTNVQPVAAQTVKDFIRAINIGDPLLLTDLTNTLKNIPGVQDVTIVLPATSQVVTSTQIIVSSNVTVSQFPTSAIALKVTIT